MTNKEKLKDIKKLADAMYYAAQYLTTDASRLHKAMEEYHQFIIHEWREEPVSNSDWLTELQEKLDNATPEQLEELWNKYNGVDEEEPVSEDLEEAAEKYAYELCPSIGVANTEAEQSFKAGAKWQHKQLEKNRLAACDRQTEEEAEIERDFVMGIIEKENRLPAFDDAIKYGMERMKQQMMKNLWKPADGDDLPEIDREVIALLDNGKVVFAHRPPEYWDGKDIVTGKVTRNYPKTYGKDGWNIPDVKYWLDIELPKEIEL